jgi:hypothetical protein
LHPLLGAGVLKTNGFGMKSLPWHELKAIFDKRPITTARGTSQDFIASIYRIAKKWMTEVLEMRSDLVGSACFEVTLHQRDVFERF